MNKIILNKPLKINGQEIKELTYDTGEITVDQFCEAEARKTTVIGNKIGATARELDNAFHLYIGFMAIIAVNQHIDVADLEPGSTSEQQITFAVTRYQLIVGGVEICLIDQLKGIMRINGKDYAKSINSLL